AAATAVEGRVLGQYLALPFRIEEIVDRAHLFGPDPIGIDEDEAVDGTEWPQNVTAFGIDERRAARLPFRAISGFGQQEEREEWVDHPVGIKHIEAGAGADHEGVDRENPR